MMVTWAEVWGGGACSFRIAACLLCPQDSAYLRPTRTPPPTLPSGLAWPLSSKAHTRVGSPETSIHACVTVYTHAHVCARLHVFVILAWLQP